MIFFAKNYGRLRVFEIAQHVRILLTPTRLLVLVAFHCAKKALQAVGEYISHEVKNLHVYTCICSLLTEQKKLVLFVFCAKVSNAQDTS